MVEMYAGKRTQGKKLPLKRCGATSDQSGVGG